MIIFISTDSSKVLSNFPSELKTSAVQVGTLDITHTHTQKLLINVCTSTSTQLVLMYLEMGFNCMTWMTWSCIQMTDCKMNLSASFCLWSWCTLDSPRALPTLHYWTLALYLLLHCACYSTRILRSAWSCFNHIHFCLLLSWSSHWMGRESMVAMNKWKPFFKYSRVS